MPTTWGQTSFKHTDKEVQREFERKSTPVVTNKQIVGGSGDNPLLSNSTDSSDNSQYTIYHNGIAVNTIGRNRSINFIDLEKDTTNMKRIEFKVSASGDSSGEDALLEAYYNPGLPSGDLFYSEEFHTDKYFTNEPHAMLSDLSPNYIKFGTVVYHDVKHNFNLSDYKKVFWSIFYIGEPTCKSVPIVIPIDGNTIRVYSSVRYGSSSGWQYLNTDLMSMPEEEMVAKESVPKFFISVHAIMEEIAKIINGGYPDTINYISILNGGEPSTINYVSIVNGGTP